MNKKKPKIPHKKPCKYCPTAHFPIDPENQDVKTFVEKGLMSKNEAMFVCAWRPWKLCKGQFDHIQGKNGSLG